MSLSPQIVYTNDTLTATAVSSDADGDTVSLTYEWDVDGIVVQSGSDNTLDGTTYFDKGSVVSVNVTPNDGTEDGITLSSNGVTISNSIPASLLVSTSPSSPTAGVDDVICSASATDDDGESPWMHANANLPRAPRRGTCYRLSRTPSAHRPS